MTSIDDESKIAKEAQAIIRSLVPSTPCAKNPIDNLRKAAKIATVATQNKFASEVLVLTLRHAVGIKLSQLCAALEKETATQEIIDAAKRAVEAWLTGLSSLSE
jgi:hypothetical protein